MKIHTAACSFLFGLSICTTVASIPVLAQSTAPAAGTASVTAPSDNRWTPYLGCWRLLMENVRNQGIDDLIRSTTQNTVTPGVVVCVQPAGPGSSSESITMTTFTDGRRALDQTITADGTGHPVSASGCVGSETSDWSRDGQRLFTTVDMTCGSRPKQSISGLTLFAQGPAWVDIQVMTSGDDQQVRVRRYMRTTEQPEGVAPLPLPLAARAMAEAQDASARKLSQADVTEASARVASQAVEAAIVETESRFTLNSRALTQLADAKVSPNVIDLMVAQSFPSRFRVERPVTIPAPTASPFPSVLPGGATAQYPVPYPVYPYSAYDPLFFGYYYSPFAYPYYWSNGYYFRGPTYYITTGGGSIISDGGSGNSGSGAVSSDRGQVVNGRGYTRVHTGSGSDSGTAGPGQHTTTSTTRTIRSATPSSGTDASSSAPSSSGSSGSSGSSSSSSGSSSSGASGGVSSSGGYSGGGSGDTGRTAQPR